MARIIGLFGSLVGVAALVAVVWWLRSDRGPEAPSEARPPFVLPVSLATVVEGQLAPRAILTGTVRAPGRARLAFETEGVLAELSVREVDRFARGDVLARLRAVEQELQVAAAEADVELAREELAKLRAGTRAEEKARLAAERDVVAAEEALAAAEVKRGERLFSDRHVSEADLDRLVAEHQAAIARTRAAEEVLAEAEAGTRAEDIAIAEAKVRIAEADVALAREALAKTELVAPGSGVVLDRLAPVGAYLARGTPVLEVVDLEALEVDVEIPSRFASSLSETPRVRLVSDDLDGLELDARLDVVVPAADERSRNSRGLIRLVADDERAARLVPGMFLRVEIELAARSGAIVPSDAVRVTEQGTIVVRARRPGPASMDGSSGDAAADPPGGGTDSVVAELVAVRVLASDGQRSVVEGVLEPLRAGDEVVVTGVDLAFPGATLLPRTPVAPAPSEESE